MKHKLYTSKNQSCTQRKADEWIDITHAIQIMSMICPSLPQITQFGLLICQQPLLQLDALLQGFQFDPFDFLIFMLLKCLKSLSVPLSLLLHRFEGSICDLLLLILELLLVFAIELVELLLMLMLLIILFLCVSV